MYAERELRQDLLSTMERSVAAQFERRATKPRRSTKLSCEGNDTDRVSVGASASAVFGGCEDGRWRRRWFARFVYGEYERTYLSLESDHRGTMCATAVDCVEVRVPVHGFDTRYLMISSHHCVSQHT